MHVHAYARGHVKREPFVKLSFLPGCLAHFCSVLGVTNYVLLVDVISHSVLQNVG